MPNEMIKLARKDFQELTTDKDRWQWLIENKDVGFVVWLDNDNTYVGAEDDEDFYVSFDDYVGSDQGTRVLLDVLGINSEWV